MKINIWIPHTSTDCPIHWARGGDYRLQLEDGTVTPVMTLSDASEWNWHKPGYIVAFMLLVDPPAYLSAQS